MNRKQKKMLIRILVTSVLFIGVHCIHVNEVTTIGLYLLMYFIIGYDILSKAIKGILNRQVFDENFLMAIATVGAMLLGEYSEGTAVMLFYQIGEWFQSYAVNKSRKNIIELMDIRPDFANVIKEDGNVQTVDPDEVEIGTRILIRPGEKIPIDGIVIQGSSSLNTSALTGESYPREVNVNDEVVSGCVNLNGLLYVETTKEFEDSTVSKILDMVENASSKKSKSEKFISKFAKYYTPIVCYSALALIIFPSVYFWITQGNPQWEIWVYRALTFLVISCPCALVISIPLSFFAGIGGASKTGVLVKGSNYLETLAKSKVVVFDKTGTLTEGVFEVVDVHHNQVEKEKLIEYAALAESFSTHPISKSLLKAYGQDVDRQRVQMVEEISGEGVVAQIDEQRILVGNDKLMTENQIEYHPCHEVGTIVHVSIDDKYMGHIIISDRIKNQSSKTIADLKKEGILKTVMLTGDKKTVADVVNKEIGVDVVYSELLPQDKVQQVETLLAQAKNHEKLIFVGDGINDAPVLTRADVGIAMGALGSDAAIEAADIVLMDDNPYNVVKAIKIAKKCLTIVYENIYFAIGIKVICLILGAFGFANMWLAIFADVGVMVLAVLNAIRTLHVKSI